MDSASERLRNEVRNLMLAHRLFPVEAYEFPQARVADFWKEVFSEKGILVFGSEEIPQGVRVIQMEFTLPDDPPFWLVVREEQHGPART